VSDRYEPDDDVDDDVRARRANLAQVATDTIAVTKVGEYVAASGARVEIGALVDASVEATRVILDAAPLVARAHEAAQGRTHRVEVTSEKTGECARRLVREGARRVALLNFANGVRIGGGFLYGARAQEEDLCRCSALYASLSSKAAQGFYVENHCTGSALVSDALIVTPQVPFFRDDTSPTLAFLDVPFMATVITAAAPDLGWLHAQVDSNLVKPVSEAHIAALFERRARAIIASAHDDGADALVLGAWGCGAFGNDPDLVAKAFARAMTDVGACIERVVFAVWPPKSVNGATFRAVLAPASSSP
jgi:uncharacterized protein (TIGR02452 family)